MVQNNNKCRFDKKSVGINSHTDMQCREEKVAVALACLGWITPIWISASEKIDLLGDGEPEKVDAAFVKYYAEDGENRYERLTRELLRVNIVRPWFSLIQQIDSAYRRGDYAIVVPAAFVILEGLLGQGQKLGQSLRDNVKNRVPEPSEGYSLRRVMWLAISEFIGKLFGRQNFDGDKPRIINRHWILHGRVASDWSQADSLRLIQACYVATYLVINPD